MPDNPAIEAMAKLFQSFVRATVIEPRSKTGAQHEDCDLRDMQVLVLISDASKMTTSELTQTLGIQPSSMIIRLFRMEKRGLIIRSEGRDKREKPWVLTKKGTRLLEQLSEGYTAALQPIWFWIPSSPPLGSAEELITRLDQETKNKIKKM